MIEMMNIPVYLSGNIIDLGDYQLQVAEACSGLRYLFPFLSLGVIAAYMFHGKLWQKAVIIVSTVPITVLMNSVRIAFTGYMVQAYGAEQAEGALHFFEGWVVFLFCLAALYGVIALLGRASRPPIKALDALAAPELPAAAPSRGRAQPRAVFAASIALLVAGFAIAEAVTVESLIVPERRAFANVPAEFDGWEAKVRPMDPSVAETLGADDTIVVDLGAPDGAFFNLYMAYLDAQRDGRSWHSPRQCIPGGGWEIARHDIRKGVTASGRPIAYNRMLIENGDARQLVYYWYDQRGRKVANEFVMKFWLIYDAVARKRSDGAMVRLITPLDVADTLEAADARLLGMVDRVDAFLPAYVPD
jgi:exosortase D (VPLPA-CTERM-specific)